MIDPNDSSSRYQACPNDNTGTLFPIDTRAGYCPVPWAGMFNRKPVSGLVTWYLKSNPEMVNPQRG